MAEVEELLDDVVLALPAAEEVRARGNQRRRRRRAGAVGVLVAAVVAGVSWAVLPGDGARPARPVGVPTALPSPSTGSPMGGQGLTPYKRLDKDGDYVVVLPSGKELPEYGKWHWQTASVPSSTNVRLPKLVTCAGWYTGEKQYGILQYTTLNKGLQGAQAWQRYADFDDPADAGVMAGVLRETLADCGFKVSGKNPDTPYTRTDRDGRKIRVTVEHGKWWIYVSEIREGGSVGGAAVTGD